MRSSRPQRKLEACRAAILTVSDACARGTRNDESGGSLRTFLEQEGADVIAQDIVPDDQQRISSRLKCYADSGADLVLTTGGTGLGPRDLTPEATRAVLDREAPGLSEAMRSGGAARTRRAFLSRGICGLRGRTLIINLPGSPQGAVESLEAIVDIIPHALAMIRGEGHGKKNQKAPKGRSSRLCRD